MLLDRRAHHQYILELARKWMTGILMPVEQEELEAWYRSLEDRTLGSPIEMTIDRVEKRLHEQFEQDASSGMDQEDSPPYPL